VIREELKIDGHYSFSWFVFFPPTSLFNTDLKFFILSCRQGC